jgi:hypothetical protein
MLRTLDAGGFIELQPPPPWHSATASDQPAFNSAAAGDGQLVAVDGHTTCSATSSVWSQPTSALAVDDEHTVRDFSSRDAEEDLGFGDGIFESDDADSNGSTEASAADQQDTPTPADEPAEPQNEQDAADDTPAVSQSPGLLGQLISEARQTGETATSSLNSKQAPGAPSSDSAAAQTSDSTDVDHLSHYEPDYATATPQLELLFAFRSINSIYGLFLAEHMHRASYTERLQLLEAALDMPGSVAKSVRVPFADVLPEGPLATDYLDKRILSEGLATQDELTGYRDEVTGRRIPPLVLADKMQRIFRSEFPGIHDARSTSVWCIGELLQFGGNFNKYVRARDLTKQEGIIFRHCLRMILLCGEFAQIEPPHIDPVRWRQDLNELAALLTMSCREVDPASTDETLILLEAVQSSSDDFKL